MPKVQTVPQAPANTMATLGPSVVISKSQRRPQAKANKLLPSVTVEPRRSPFIAMLSDPVNAPPALPPVSLPARCIPVKVYQEVLLTTDSAGNAGLCVYPLMNGHTKTINTFTGTNMSTFGTLTAHGEYTNFAANFRNYIPLTMEVVTRYTGSMTSVSGRFYGIVGSASEPDVANFPREPNGCEGITSEGISCTWYSTDPVWSNPCLSTITSSPTEWMDIELIIALIGGPVSVTNVVTVGIWFHFAAFPKNGIVGLTPMASLPDPNAALAAALMRADETGAYSSAMTAEKRDKQRSKIRGVLKDTLKVGGRVIGTMYPQFGMASEAAELLSKLVG